MYNPTRDSQRIKIQSTPRKRYQSLGGTVLSRYDHERVNVFHFASTTNKRLKKGEKNSEGRRTFLSNGTRATEQLLSWHNSGFYIRTTTDKIIGKLDGRIDTGLHVLHGTRATQSSLYRVSSKTFMLTIDGFVWRLVNTFAPQTRDVAEIEKVYGD